MIEWMDELEAGDLSKKLCGFEKLGFIESILGRASLPPEELRQIENGLHLLTELEANELIEYIKNNTDERNRIC